MTIVRIGWNDAVPAECRGGALTIGNFDGVHRGHQALLGEVCAQSKAVGGPAIVMTFDPHPLELLRPRRSPPLLTTSDARAQLLCEHGADCVVILETTRELLNFGARDFFDTVIRDNLQPKTMVPGFNFAFGRNREGTVEVLSEFCRDAGIGFVLSPPKLLRDEAISSSRIRAALEMGNVSLAQELLGRMYSLAGRVGVGAKRGRLIGFPTANLEQIPTATPGNGVYAVRVLLDGATYAGAANIGPNPTFDETERKIEVHLLDFDGDGYGTMLTVQFAAKLRDTQKFDGVEALKRQLQIDVDAVRKLVNLP